MMMMMMTNQTSRVFLPSKSTKKSFTRIALATCGGAVSMNSSNDDDGDGDDDDDDVNNNGNDISSSIVLT